MSKAQIHQVVVSENDLWETPFPELNEAMRKYDIHPTIDVCATLQNAKFPKFFTPEDNGLNKEWDEDFFMNCPYSEIDTWMAKALEQHLKHNVNGLCLVFSKTSVKWWHRFVEGKAETHFQKGRIRFLLNGIEPRYCNKCKTRFVEEIEHCKTCKRCKVCKEVFLDGPEKCTLCDSETEPRKIGKSSPTYDSAWVIFRKKECLV